jgi:uroporphyrinogen-III synthase
LVELVAREFARTALPLLYLAGEDRSVDLAKELAGHGLNVRTVVVYRAVAAERLPPEIKQAIAAGELDGVLHYSRRSTDAFVRCLHRARLRERALALRHFCLSAQVAVPLAQLGAADVRIAGRPEEAALLELVGSP